jgi:hypothetical protein
MQAQGTFEIQMQAEPPYDVVDDVSLGRVSFDKQFSGALEAHSKVSMLGARTKEPGSAGYVALERVTGTLSGQKGSFVLLHRGIMDRGSRSLSVTVVPDSATGELAGLRGQIVEGKHFYVFDYELA